MTTMDMNATVYRAVITPNIAIVVAGTLVHPSLLAVALIGNDTQKL